MLDTHIGNEPAQTLGRHKLYHIAAKAVNSHSRPEPEYFKEFFFGGRIGPVDFESVGPIGIAPRVQMQVPAVIARYMIGYKINDDAKSAVVYTVDQSTEFLHAGGRIVGKIRIDIVPVAYRVW